MTTTRETLVAQIDEIQVWFASRPYGWRETATPQQIQQWADREQLEADLIARLELLSE